MGRYFRPVIEMWGPESSCFIDSDDVVYVIESLSRMAGAGHTGVSDYDGVYTLYVPDGEALIKFIETETVDSLIQRLDFKEVTNPLEADLRNLLNNMKALVLQYRAALNSDGILTFYIDMY